METLFLDALRIDKDRLRHRQTDVLYRHISSIEYRRSHLFHRDDLYCDALKDGAYLVLHLIDGRQFRIRQHKRVLDIDKHWNEALWNVKETLSEKTFSSRLNLYEEALASDGCLHIGNHRLDPDGSLFLRKVRLGNVWDGSFLLFLLPFDLMIRKKIKSANERIGDAFLGERYRIDLGRDRDCLLHLLKHRFGLVWRDGTRPGLRDGDPSGLLEAIMAIGAHVCTADGDIHPAELAAFRNQFRLEGAEAADIRRRFDALLEEKRSIADVAQDLIDRLDTHDRPLLEHILVGSALTAAADGRYAAEEHAVIIALAGAFGIAEDALDGLLMGVGLHNPSRRPVLDRKPGPHDRPHPAASVWTGEEAARHLAVLNLDSAATLQDIKSAYRQLVRRLHPDQLKAEGASSDQIRRNEDALKTINLSYSWLQQRHIGA